MIFVITDARGFGEECHSRFFQKYIGREIETRKFMTNFVLCVGVPIILPLLFGASHEILMPQAFVFLDPSALVIPYVWFYKNLFLRPTDKQRPAGKTQGNFEQT